MSWLRIDDGFAQHPKVIRLVAKDRWTWIEILCYCARYRTEGVVPAAIGQVVRGASASFLGRCFELELLDLPIGGDGCFVVHDWADFNPKDPTAASRQQRKRERDATVTEAVTETVTDRDSRVGARARPVPSRPPVDETVAVDEADSGRISTLVKDSLANAAAA